MSASDLRQDLLALARGDLGGQGAFHFAEGAQAHGGVLGDRLFLLGGPNLDLRLERAASEDRREQAGADVPDRIVVILQHEQLARDRAEAGRQRDHRQAGRLGLANPVERDRHAPLRGDHVGAPLEQLRWQPGRDRGRETRQPRRRSRGGRGVAAEQELERANRLLASELELAQDVAIGRRRWRAR